MLFRSEYRPIFFSSLTVGPLSSKTGCSVGYKVTSRGKVFSSVSIFVPRVILSLHVAFLLEIFLQRLISCRANSVQYRGTPLQFPFSAVCSVGFMRRHAVTFAPLSSAVCIESAFFPYAFRPQKWRPPAPRLRSVEICSHTAIF